MNKIKLLILSICWVVKYKILIHYVKSKIDEYINGNDISYSKILILDQYPDPPYGCLLVQYDALLNHLNKGVEDLPMSIVMGLNPTTCAFIVNQSFAGASGEMRTMILEHEIGHLREGHLSGVDAIDGILSPDVAHEIAADRHVTNKKLLVGLLDQCITHPGITDIKDFCLRKTQLLADIRNPASNE